MPTSSRPAASSVTGGVVMLPRTRRAARTPKPATDDISALTVVQLRERAKAAGRSGYSRLTKAQLVELLSA